MSDDLEQLINELETVSARMVAVTCWEQTDEFRKLLSVRVELCARLMKWQDLDEPAAERVQALIQAGNGLMAQAMAIRQSVVDSFAETEAQRCFASGLGGTLRSRAQAHGLDLKA